MKVSPFVVFALAAAAQDFPEAAIDKVAAGLRFAEGPVWSLEGFLLFSDTPGLTLKKWVPGKGVVDGGDRPGGPSGNAYDEKGNLYTCEVRDRRVVRVAKNGKTDVVASRFEGKKLNAPNDVVVRRDNNVYFTDPAFGNQQDTRELDFYGVYRVSPKADLEAVARWKTRPNGIALSPNGRTLYVTDSDARSVRAFDLDRAGAASNERTVIAKVPGVPGGIRVDEKGNLYVAAKSVFIYSPRGEVLKEIKFSEAPSNLAFGDSDFATLYVTTHTTVERVRLGVKGAVPYAPQVP